LIFAFFSQRRAQSSPATALSEFGAAYVAPANLYFSFGNGVQNA
jgi:hypothetical protein